MIAVDTNILVYAHRQDVDFHRPAAIALASLAEADEAWAIPWHCLVEFIANVTNSRIWRGAQSTMSTALEQLGAWTESPSLRLIGEGPGFADTWMDVLRTSGVSGAQVHDARIAAICIYHGVSELLTADRDFGRFPRLKTRNPLVS